MKLIGIEDSIPNDLHKILKKVRRQIIKEHGTSLDCCFDASYMVYQLYRDKINKKIKMIKGSIYDGSWHLGNHVWIEVNNHIVDITADQFNGLMDYKFKAIIYVKKNVLDSIFRRD